MANNSPLCGESDPDRPARLGETKCRENRFPYPMRVRAFLLFALLVTVAFCVPLTELVRYAMEEDLHSHVVLIPFVTIYLIYSKRLELPQTWKGAPVLLMLSLALGTSALALLWSGSADSLSRNDSIGLMVVSYLGFLLAGVFGILGRTWAAAGTFPLFFLVFMIPLPDGLSVTIERILMLASADVSAALFSASGTPFFRTGQVFELPGIVLEVAQECSGIRSSWVLFITSLLASFMLLKSPWRRGLLVGLVIPLGILRNGLRILVIGMLCVRYGPHMIHSPVHRSGGPYFFALSLIPFFLALWWLRRGERTSPGSGAEEAPDRGRADSGSEERSCKNA